MMKLVTGVAQEEEIVRGRHQLHLGELSQVQEDPPRGHWGRDGRRRRGFPAPNQSLRILNGKENGYA